MQIAIKPGTLPIPININIGIKYTKLGIVCIISRIGLKNASNKLLLEATIPNGIPIIMQKITAVKIMANVVIVSCHKSTRSIKIKLSAERIASFIPFVLNANTMKIKITIGNGIKLNNESNPFKTVSIGADNFLKSGRCMNNHSLICFSIHSAIGTYTS